jgi:hypothetical protein
VRGRGRREGGRSSIARQSGASWRRARAGSEDDDDDDDDDDDGSFGDEGGIIGGSFADEANGTALLARSPGRGRSRGGRSAASSGSDSDPVVYGSLVYGSSPPLSPLSRAAAAAAAAVRDGPPLARQTSEELQLLAQLALQRAKLHWNEYQSVYGSGAGDLSTTSPSPSRPGSLRAGGGGQRGGGGSGYGGGFGAARARMLAATPGPPLLSRGSSGGSRRSSSSGGSSPLGSPMHSPFASPAASPRRALQQHTTPAPHVGSYSGGGGGGGGGGRGRRPPPATAARAHGRGDRGRGGFSVAAHGVAPRTAPARQAQRSVRGGERRTVRFDMGGQKGGHGMPSGGGGGGGFTRGLHPAALRQPTPVAHGAPTPTTAWQAQRTPMWEQPGTRGRRGERSGRGSAGGAGAADDAAWLGYGGREHAGHYSYSAAVTPRVETRGPGAQPSRRGSARREKQRTPPKHFTFDEY